MQLFIKNSDGKPSASLTMTTIAFFLVTLWLLVWVVGVSFGLPVPPFDATAAMTYLTPLLTLYFGRRWTSNSQGAWTGEGGAPGADDTATAVVVDEGKS